MVSDATLRRLLPRPTVALLGDLIRALLWLLVFLLWVFFAQVYVRMVRLTLADPSSSDFTIFYYTARMVADGLPMYGESPSRYGIEWAASHLGNLNPPHFQLLFAPLASLTYAQALFAWVALSVAGLVTSLAMIVRELDVTLTWRRVAICGAFTISLAPFTTVAVTGEGTFLLMVPFVLMWRAWRRERWTAAGAWLGMLVSLKLFFLVFAIWLALARCGRALGAMLGTALAIVALGSLAFGLESYRLWTGSLETVGWQWMAMNASWPGFVSRVFESGGRIVPLVSLPGLVLPLSLVGSAVLVIVSLKSVCREDIVSRAGGPSGPPVRDAQVLTLFLGAILASPLGWVYYLPLAYAPIVGWMVERTARSGSALPAMAVARVALGVAFALLFVPQELANAGQPSRIATATLASVYFYATALLFGVFATHAAVDGPASMRAGTAPA